MRILWVVRLIAMIIGLSRKETNFQLVLMKPGFFEECGGTSRCPVQELQCRSDRFRWYGEMFPEYSIVRAWSTPALEKPFTKDGYWLAQAVSHLCQWRGG